MVVLLCRQKDPKSLTPRPALSDGTAGIGQWEEGGAMRGLMNDSRIAACAMAVAGVYPWVRAWGVHRQEGFGNLLELL